VIDRHKGEVLASPLPFKILLFSAYNMCKHVSTNLHMKGGHNARRQTINP